MPIVHITSFPQNKQVRAALAKDISAAITKHTGMPPEVTYILFSPCPKDHWAVGQTLCSEMGKKK